MSNNSDSVYGAVIMSKLLANCVNYADLNNSMLRMHGHISVCFFRCEVLFLQDKHSGILRIVASV